MGEQVSYEDAVLAVGRELGPVAGDRGVEVEQAAVDQDQCREIGHGLADRPDRGEGVLLPRDRPVPVEPAVPDVDEDLAVLDDAE